jgi:hypothetical protein
MTPLPKDTVRNNLQLIANASNCTLDVGRDGSIKILKKFSLEDLYDSANTLMLDSFDSVIKTQETASTTDFRFTNENIYNIPSTSKIPPLRNVVTTSRTYTVASTAKELAKVTLVGTSSPKTYFIDYNLATNVSVTLTGTLVASGVTKYYAYGCEITLSGSGDVVLNGKEIVFAETSISVNANLNGIDCIVSNQLITNSTWANNYASWVSSILVLNNEYAFANRGFVELDMGDLVSLDTLYTSQLPIIMTENNISFDGTLSGTSKAIIAR